VEEQAGCDRGGVRARARARACARVAKRLLQAGCCRDRDRWWASREAKAEEGEDRQMVGVDPDVGSSEFSEFPQPECTCLPHSVTPYSLGGPI